VEDIIAYSILDAKVRPCNFGTVAKDKASAVNLASGASNDQQRNFQFTPSQDSISRLCPGM
jgi:hypothetical protein